MNECCKQLYSPLSYLTIFWGRRKWVVLSTDAKYIILTHTPCVNCQTITENSANRSIQIICIIEMGMTMEAAITTNHPNYMLQHKQTMTFAIFWSTYDISLFNNTSSCQGYLLSIPSHGLQETAYYA